MCLDNSREMLDLDQWIHLHVYCFSPSMRSPNHPVVNLHDPISRGEDHCVVRGDQYADACFLDDGAQERDNGLSCL